MVGLFSTATSPEDTLPGLEKDKTPLRLMDGDMVKFFLLVGFSNIKNLNSFLRLHKKT